MDPPETKKRKSDPAEVVRVNVGGTIFTTTRTTLLQFGSRYFKRVLEEARDGIPLAGARRDGQGNLFIDRDASTFGRILSYLRNPECFVVHDKEEQRIIHTEALFFGLDHLHETTRPVPMGYDEQYLSEEDQLIHCEAMSVRSDLLEGLRLTHADDLLIDLFNVRQQPVASEGEERLPLETIFSAEPSSPKCCLLFHHQVECARGEFLASPPSSTEEFLERLERHCGSFIKNFPMENVVIAGGAVVACLQGRLMDTRDKRDGGDVDVFLVTDDPVKARTVFDTILEHMSKVPPGRENAGRFSDRKLLVTRSRCAVTFVTDYPRQRKVQLILVRHQCIADVLFRFDIDCCQVAWDGKRVLATPSALRALRTGINICQPNRASSQYELRLAKYAGRGFLVAVPGLDPDKISAKLVRNNYFIYYHDQLMRIRLRFVRGYLQDYRVDEDTAGGIKGLALLIVLATTNLPNVNSNYIISYRRLQENGVGLRWSVSDDAPPGDLIYYSSCFRLIDYDGTPWPLEEGEPVIGRGRNRPDAMYARLQLHSRECANGFVPKIAMCFELLDGGGLPKCTHVLDAGLQYKPEDLLRSPGCLPRYLEFPLSTDVGSNPFVNGVDAEEWTYGVYSDSEPMGGEWVRVG